VTMKVVAKKRVADELGKESDVPIDDLVDVGVVDAKGDAISVWRQRIRSEESTFTMTVDRLPAKAGIDPLNKLIDRRPEDNAIVVAPG
jgi:ABC-2 type transport system permease protein